MKQRNVGKTEYKLVCMVVDTFTYTHAHTQTNTNTHTQVHMRKSVKNIQHTEYLFLSGGVCLN